MSGLTAKVRREVVAEVYRVADNIDWDGLTDRQRTTMYDRWLDTPDIGGKLTPFMSRERARVWLKDSPMKEYARARNGIGPFADLAASRFPGPGETARRLLGDGWDAKGTVQEKPLRCRIASGAQERLMIWGPPLTLRDMVWAGINAIADGEPTPLLVIATPHERTLGDGEKRRNIRLGEIAGLEVRHMVMRASRNRLAFRG